MRRRLQAWLDQLTFPDELTDRQAQLFQRTLLVLMIGCTLSLPVILLIPASVAIRLSLAVAQLAVVAGSVAALVVLRSGRLARAALISAGSLQISVTMVLLVIGIRNGHAALLAYILPLLLSAMFLSRRGIVACVLLSVSLVGAVGGLEWWQGVEAGMTESGLYPAPLIGLMFAVLFSVIALILDRHTGALRSALAALELELKRRQQLEEQLLASQRLESLGRLAGGVAHDFNNLLTVMLANAELASDMAAGNSELRHDLDEIRSAATKAARLTRQLLAFGRRQVLELQPISMNELLRSLEPLLRRLIGVDVALVLQLDEPLWPALADSGQIEQVVINIAANARDAMPDGGTLYISSRNLRLRAGETERWSEARPGDYALIEIRDSGTGMDEAVRARIFDPFFTTKAPGQGTGLGLATCYGIVHQHRGFLSVMSSPGQGSAFTIGLPRGSGASTASIATATAPVVRRGGSERILVVDDDPSVRTIVVRTLRGLGYNVVEVADGASARALVLSGALGVPDLLLTDLVMPGEHGLTLATWLGERRPGLAVVFMSGYSDGSQRPAGLPVSAPFLQKPFTPAQLAERIRQSLDSRTPYQL